MPESAHCPLCGGSQTLDYHRDRRRAYRQCLDCALVFVPGSYHLPEADERAEYDLHQNDPEDPGYRRFLGRLAEPLLARLPVPSRGLDFGCGPGPALAQMLAAAGHEVELYDKFYAGDAAVLSGDYDFITATEVVEHLAAPGAELERLWSLLRPGGWLGVMTKLVRDPEAFSRWHYKNDPTHICFFSEQTWTWWAAGHGAGLTRIGSDVMLLQRPDQGSSRSSMSR